MHHVLLGLALGMLAGIIAVGLMMPMSFPSKRTAMMAAFISRFSIGFLTANSSLPINPIIIGLGIGFVLSVPDALVTKAYTPILVIGAILGGLCGIAVGIYG